MSQDFDKKEFSFKSNILPIDITTKNTPTAKTTSTLLKSKPTTRTIRPIPDHTKEPDTPIFDKINW